MPPLGDTIIDLAFVWMIFPVLTLVADDFKALKLLDHLFNQTTPSVIIQFFFNLLKAVLELLDPLGLAGF